MDHIIISPFLDYLDYSNAVITSLNVLVFFNLGNNTFTPTLAHASSDLGLVKTYLLSSYTGSSKLKKSI